MTLNTFQLEEVWKRHVLSEIPGIFGTRHQFHGRPFSYEPGRGEDGLGMIQAHSIYCVLYFYYYYNRVISNYQALDPRGWGPLL